MSDLENYGATTQEWAFEAPQPGLYYVTRNPMLIETMHAARPEAELLTRFAPDWLPAPTEET